VLDPPSDLIDLRSVNVGSRKILAAGPLTPVACEERDSDKRKMGIEMSAPKNYAAAPLPLNALYEIVKKPKAN
jgi:hypothetical protein